MEPGTAGTLKFNGSEMCIRDRPKTVEVAIVQKNWNDTGKDAMLDCGTFEIDSVDVSGPPWKCTLKSTSIPYTSTLRIQKKSRNWEKISLKAIADQIAKEAGMKLLYESSDNPQYDKKEQVQQSDIRFLQDLCHEMCIRDRCICGSKQRIISSNKHEDTEGQHGKPGWFCFFFWLQDTVIQVQGYTEAAGNRKDSKGSGCLLYTSRCV